MIRVKADRIQTWKTFCLKCAHGIKSFEPSGELFYIGICDLNGSILVVNRGIENQFALKLPSLGKLFYVPGRCPYRLEIMLKEDKT